MIREEKRNAACRSGMRYGALLRPCIVHHSTLRNPWMVSRNGRPHSFHATFWRATVRALRCGGTVEKRS